jgi:ribokinase
MMSARRPVVSVLGIVSRDESLLIDQYPAEGSFARLSNRVVASGGTTGNMATGLARLGAAVRMFTRVGDDDWGKALIKSLLDEGIDSAGVLTGPGQSDLSVILVSGSSGERTILWHQAPTLTKGNRIDIDRLFRADLTVIDTPDYDLVRFLTDLPAHTYPKSRLLGTLTYLANVAACDNMEVACRFDVLVGNEREFRQLTGKAKPETAFAEVVNRTSGANLRLVVMTRGEHGAIGATDSEQIQMNAFPANVKDTTGAGDAFAAGLAYATALRWDLSSSLRLANAVAGFAVTALGAQTALPSLSAALNRAGISMEDGCDNHS